jgi:IclR family transcriptional regulator, acetate operon repressor
MDPRTTPAPESGASVGRPDADGPLIPEQRLPVQIVARPADPQVHAGQTIAAVERALDVLLLFGSLGRGDLGVTEISSELGMSKAAVHRVLSSLRSRGLVVLDTATHRYSLGAAALSLGVAYREQLNVLRLAAPDMAKLSDAFGETVILSVRTNDLQVFVEQVLPDRDVRIDVPLGLPVPLHTGASGKVLLAHFTDENVEDYIARRGLTPYTSATITDPDRLRAEVAAVRRRGFAESYGERDAGAAAVAAAVLDEHGRPAAVLAVAGPADRVRDRLPEFAPALAETCADLSRRMGYVRLDDLDGLRD